MINFSLQGWNLITKDNALMTGLNYPSFSEAKKDKELKNLFVLVGDQPIYAHSEGDKDKPIDFEYWVNYEGNFGNHNMKARDCKLVAVYEKYKLMTIIQSNGNVSFLKIPRE